MGILRILSTKLTGQVIHAVQIKDLTNDHLVRFHGICIDPPHQCILTEYCPKGSLQVCASLVVVLLLLLLLVVVVVVVVVTPLTSAF